MHYGGAGNVPAAQQERMLRICLLMSEITREELALAWVGGAYVAITALYLWLMNRSAEKLLRTIQQHEAGEVWQAIGAPRSVKQAVQDPDRRWREFLRSRAYRQLCSPVTASQIDAFLMKTYTGLTGLAVTGAIILIRFWPLLKPALLGE